MIWDSIILFWKGRLFQDLPMVIIRTLIGIVATAIVCIILVKIGLLFWTAALISAVLGGILQPFLFKDLKYK